MNPDLIVFSDGGSRGNPGPAAAAFIIRDKSGEILSESGRFLGVATNNVAEYRALITALEEALNLGGRRVACFLDSELVVRQLNGEYRIKEEKMRGLFNDLCKITKKFEKISFAHVPRRQNSRADWLVNQVLDSQRELKVNAP